MDMIEVGDKVWVGDANRVEVREYEVAVIDARLGQWLDTGDWWHNGLGYGDLRGKTHFTVHTGNHRTREAAVEELICLMRLRVEEYGRVLAEVQRKYAVAVELRDGGRDSSSLQEEE